MIIDPHTPTQAPETPPVCCYCDNCQGYCVEPDCPCPKHRLVSPTPMSDKELREQLAKLAGLIELPESVHLPVTELINLFKIREQQTYDWVEREVIGKNEVPVPDPKAKDPRDRIGTCWACYESDYCIHESRDELRAEQCAILQAKREGK